MQYDDVLARLQTDAAKHGLSEADMRMLASDIASDHARADSVAAPPKVTLYEFAGTEAERDAVQALLKRMRGMA